MGCGTGLPAGMNDDVRVLSVPSAGLWGVEQRSLKYVKAVLNFQYPLRAYGVWNSVSVIIHLSAPVFQYPLRAYGVWNVHGDETVSVYDDLSVPSAGLWGVELTASAPRGELAELSVPSAGLWGVEQRSRW